MNKPAEWNKAQRDARLAKLPTGKTMSYDEYLLTGYWLAKKNNRLDVDNYQCAFCKKELKHDGSDSRCHHLDYTWLGDERYNDIITLCDKCHTKFHEIWKREEYWTDENAEHWRRFSITQSELFALECIERDYLIQADINLLNMCNKDTIKKYLLAKHGDKYDVDPFDIEQIIRNFRYEKAFDFADKNGWGAEELETFLDINYGRKGGRGNPNPLRAKAKAFYSKHTMDRMRYHYSENKNINELMEVIKNEEAK